MNHVQGWCESGPNRTLYRVFVLRAFHNYCPSYILSTPSPHLHVTEPNCVSLERVRNNNEKAAYGRHGYEYECRRISTPAIANAIPYSEEGSSGLHQLQERQKPMRRRGEVSEFLIQPFRSYSLWPVSPPRPGALCSPGALPTMPGQRNPLYIRKARKEKCPGIIQCKR